MNKELVVSKSIDIKAGKNVVWDLLVNPEKIKIYFFGTEAISEWKAGSPLIFQGEYQGKFYQDKGVITKFEIGEILQHTYLSSFSGLNDEPGNYSLVTFELNDAENSTQLKITQTGFVSGQARDHSSTAWENVLTKIKELAETN